MQMQVSRLPDAGYEFVSTLLREESRDFQALYSASTERSDDLVRSCGWCKKIAIPQEQWVEVEEAVEVLRLFDRQSLPRITHGICPQCHTQFLAEIDQFLSSSSGRVHRKQKPKGSPEDSG
jgi:hypothetical protein